VLRRQLSYPGLFEMFDRFYAALESGAPSPTSPESVMQTVEACERIEHALRSRIPAIPATPASRPTVVVTGGTGLLGKAVVRRLLRHGETPLVLTRRTPPPAERIVGAQYRAADLGSGIVPLPSSASVVIHCAAETVGGWDAHQRNSIDATRHLLHGMHAAGIRRLVHVSSLAVIDGAAKQPLSEASALEQDGRRRGAYVWGKLEAERVAADAPRTHDIAVRIARPGALISAEGYEPPGKLGRAIGGTYVAVGRKRSTIPICDVELAASVLVWMAMRFDDAPPLLNVVDETPPERRALTERLVAERPGTRVVWISAPVLALMSGAATALQKTLRPAKPAVSVWSAFAAPRVDTTNLRAAMHAVRSTSRATMREGSRA
jgi:nucleoside-diphosphate-sugar epimerase